jgi:hypothetical protein
MCRVFLAAERRRPIAWGEPIEPKASVGVTPGMRPQKNISPAASPAVTPPGSPRERKVVGLR